MKRLLKILFLISVTYVNLIAENNSTCIEKINQLNALKSQQNSALEKTTAFLLTSNLTAFQKSEDDKLLEQKIRLLEIELKSCKD